MWTACLACIRTGANVAEWPQVPGADQQYVKLAQKQGDPLDKAGVVGAFCRIYDIYRAMEELPAQRLRANRYAGTLHLHRR